MRRRGPDDISHPALESLGAKAARSSRKTVEKTVAERAWGGVRKNEEATPSSERRRPHRHLSSLKPTKQPPGDHMSPSSMVLNRCQCQGPSRMVIGSASEKIAQNIGEPVPES
jgi:hypothetical protein